MKKLLWTLAVVVAVLLTIFLVQNAAEVELQFLFWSLVLRRWVLVLAVLGIGFVFGWVFRGRFAEWRRKRREIAAARKQAKLEKASSPQEGEGG